MPLKDRHETTKQGHTSAVLASAYHVFFRESALILKMLWLKGRAVGRDTSGSRGSDTRCQSVSHRIAQSTRQ